ncbi:MAG: tetratricopeptide repeat protein, partial [Bacteroidota bacterium]
NDPSVSFANPPVLRPEPLKDHQSSLIDRFIRMEPKITPGKSADYDTGNLARESLEEDFGLVTETMAILFARQGKLDRARKVYRRLIELHPEKSVYFAAQLKNLNANKKG